MIDMEVQRLVSEAFQRAVGLVQQHEEKLMRLVQALLEKEVLSAKELREILVDDAPKKSETSSASSTTEQ